MEEDEATVGCTTRRQAFFGRIVGESL